MWKMPLRDKCCQTDHHHHGCCESVHMMEPGDPPLLQQPLNTSKSGIQQIIECFRSGTKQLKHILLKDVDTIFECKLCRSLFRGLPNLITHKKFYCPSSLRMDDNSPHVKDKQSQAVSDLLEAIYPRVDRQDYIIRLEPIETNQNAVFQYVSRADSSVENTEMDDIPAQDSVEMPEPAIEPPKAILPPTESETVDTPPAANKAIVTSENSTPSSNPELKCKNNSDCGHQLICCVCKKEFHSRRNIRRHIRKVHKKKMEELKKFIKIKKRPNQIPRRGRNKNVLVTLGRSCPVCFKSFATKANVRRHFDEVHRGLRRDSITPEIATKPGQPLSLGKTSAKNSLKTQKQKSSSKAEYNLTTCKCLLCKRNYSSQVMLKKHMQIVHKVTLSTKNTKREKKTNNTCNAELKVKVESTESAEPVPPAIVSPQNHVKITNHSNERKNTSCTEKKNALFAERKNAQSAERKGAPSSKKKSTPAIDKKTTTLSERKSTPSNESKNASTSDRKNASSSERKKASSSERKNASSSERKNASSSERKNAPSAGRKSVPSAERKKAPSAERKKASTSERKNVSSAERKNTTSVERKKASFTERKNALSPERKSAPSAERKGAPSAEKKNASSERKSTPSAEQKNASSVMRKSAPSVHRKNAPSSKRKSASSAERKNLSSAEKKSALSVQRKNASSGERKSTPSSERKSAPSAKRKSTSSAERKSAPSAERKSSSSAERKNASSSEKKSAPPTKRNKVKQSSENTKPSNQTLAGCSKKPRKSRLSAGFDFRKLYCKLCKRQFTSKQNLTKHIELHTDGNNIYVKFYRCPLCAYETRRKRDVVRHITVVHKKSSCYLGKITATLERRAVKKSIDYILNKVAKRGPQRDEGKPNGSKQDITSNSPSKKYEGSDVGIEVKVTKNFPLHSCNKCGKAFAKKTLLEHHKKTHKANASQSPEENNKTKGRHTRSKARV